MHPLRAFAPLALAMMIGSTAKAAEPKSFADRDAFAKHPRQYDHIPPSGF